MGTGHLVRFKQRRETPNVQVSLNIKHIGLSKAFRFPLRCILMVSSQPCLTTTPTKSKHSTHQAPLCSRTLSFNAPGTYDLDCWVVAALLEQLLVAPNNIPGTVKGHNANGSYLGGYTLPATRGRRYSRLSFLTSSTLLIGTSMPSQRVL